VREVRKTPTDACIGWIECEKDLALVATISYTVEVGSVVIERVSRGRVYLVLDEDGVVF